ncbi:hypothetical protein Ddye_011378 [Dipteronia dyeriana]|uniref:AAA+ ATPase domain-containing protein n=1 Tax=Dipteronia dyeriana TaxID=168575 RepID=A0AAD9X2F2_9ROSI|nr:hypothetical protein Ddye_011369 [Dipteronia dyeriana]KAK2651522.1 hypothetical protein Ddye_011378 [Dipteronia dyeriana]
MADCVSPILDIVTRLWDCTANRAVYIRDLQDNLNTLRELKRELENISKDVEGRADYAEQQQYSARTNQVKGWLQSVQLKLKEVDNMLQKGDEEIQQKCLGSCCPRHCRTSYKLGKQVIKEINVVQDLIKKGHFDVVADKVPRSMIDEMPMEKTVGMDSVFDEVWKCVEDHKVGIIGLYGMGGVGKTTLLKNLNNRFLETSHNFDVVIWAVVSKEVKLENIQETIRNKLVISDEIWKNKNKDERAAQILKRLHNKRFVLLLDDLWDRLDLSTVGVSFSNIQNGCKIVFTTRSGEVCGQMEADARFKLYGLPKEAALNLFRQKVGEDVLNSHHELPKLAEIVAEECSGLPLALVTIGRAMASRTKPEDWKHAISVLKSYPSRFTEMGKYVFPTLRFSYDSLSDNTLKTCFLYCSIFPEDHDISNRELIQLWIGEGFLDDFENMYEAQERGRFIINSLKLACLLEGSFVEGISYEEDHIKMHDVLRDMAHWLAREHGNEILVKERTGLIKSQEIGRWKEAIRVSLYGDSTKFLIETPVVCPRLQTIFIMGSKRLSTLPGTLFQSINTLTVLNLSNNKDLRELPVEIGALISLYYLNLSKSCVSKLPIEVKNLTQLRILLLDDMSKSIVIPPGVISSLSSLEMYSSINYSNECKVDMKLMIEELECLENITDVGLTFSSVSPILQFMSSSPKLQGCITRLSIRKCEELRSLDISCSTMRRMEHLEDLYIRHCDNLREVKICFENEERMQRSDPNCFCNLQILNIIDCAKMKNLSWLIYIPRLRFLYVMECSSLEEIIAWDFAGSSEIEEDVDQSLFSNLETVYIRNLPKLKSICRRAMPFPSLRDIEVSSGCRRLRKLPLNAESAKSTLRAIKGEGDWWDKLEWEDEATELAFTSKFQLQDYDFMIEDQI